jgi:hypothetical protein
VVGVLCGCRELFVKAAKLVRCWDLISGIVRGRKLVIRYCDRRVFNSEGGFSGS